MALSDCFQNLRATKGNEKATDRQLLDILSALEERKLQGEVGYDKPAAELKHEAEVTAAVLKRNTLENMQKRLRMDSRIDETSTEAGKGGVRDFATAIEAVIHGVNTDITGGKASIAREATDRSEVLLSGITSELQRADLFGAARSGKLDDQVMEELLQLGKGEAGRPGASDSAQALAIARIVKRWQDVAKGMLNKAGAWIGDYHGYIARTSHDSYKIWKAGFNQWFTDIMPALDWQRTFQGVDDPQKFMQGVYNALVTGVHLTPEGALDNARLDKGPAFTGPGSMAKKLSQGRVLHFRDQSAQPWLGYNAKYGVASPFETIIHSLDRAGRDSALMTHFGTNPRAEFEDMLRRTAEQYRDSDTEAVRNFNLGKRQDLLNRFSFLDGTANAPSHALASQAFAYARNAAIFSKLGNVAFTHLSTIATKAGELNRQGISYPKGYGEFFASMFRGYSDEEKRAVLEEMHANIIGQHSAIIERLMPNDSMPGKVSKLNIAFMKATGLTWLVNSQKRGTFFAMAQHLGGLVDRPFDGLDPKVQKQLRAFGIEQPHWDMLRNAPGHSKVDGRTFLTEQAAMRIPEDQIVAHLKTIPEGEPGHIASDAQLDTTGLTPEQAQRITDEQARLTPIKVDDFRQRLALQLHGMYGEAADRAIVTPGIPERNFWYGGMARGTWKGEMMRAASLFKMWPTAVIRQQLGAEWYGNASKVNALGNITALAVGAGMAGVLRQAIVDELNGKEHRPLNDTRTYVAGLMQGGGMGIMGDYLFGEYNRFGQNPYQSAAGPVLGGMGGDVINLWNLFKGVAEAPNAHARALAEKQIAPDLLQLAVNYAPFANLFYTRLALNMAFIWRAQEALNPGYLARSQRSLQQRTGQAWWISPSAWVNQGKVQPSPGG